MVLVALLGLTGWFVLVGADTLWAVALGDLIRSTGAIPDGIPFAVAASPDWPNPVVAGDLLLSGVNALGPSGLAILQVLLVAVTFAWVAREEGSPGRRATVLVLVYLGALSPLVVARMPSLSLVPFVLLLTVLRADERAMSRRIWWVIPLLAVWGNLHG
ncbi:MAG: hypothetical protein ACK5MP_03645, partial [Nostocoides sp.]